MSLLQILPQSNSLAFPHILLGHILLEEPKGKWHCWSKHIKQVTKSMSQHQVYHFIPLLLRWNLWAREDSWVCTVCQTHTVLSILYFQHAYLWANSQTADAKTGAFPLPRGVPIPCLRAHSLRFHFLGLLCVFSSVPDSLRATAQLGLVLFLFLQAKSTSHKASDLLGWCGLWGYSLSQLCSGCMPRLRPSTQTGQEHLMSFEFSSFWFGGNWLLCAHPQLGKMSQQS